jgi:hypothetical protein
MRHHGADVWVSVVIFGVIAAWSGLRATTIAELCVRATAFSGLFASAFAISLMVTRLNDIGHLTRGDAVGISFPFVVGAAASGMFVLLGLMARVFRGLL